MADSADQFRGQARLPRFAAPRRYELRLRPDLVAFTFSGAAAVAVDVSAPTRFLVLNAADLAIDRASIRFQGLAPAEVSLFTDDEILVLGFDKELPLGEGVLRMDFNGTLNDQLRGFYRSKYEYKGETKYMAVTQFEPVYARRCFPSWDEPAFKAKFKLILEVPSELVALSNMPVANETVAGPIKTVLPRSEARTPGRRLTRSEARTRPPPPAPAAASPEANRGLPAAASREAKRGLGRG